MIRIAFIFAFIAVLPLPALAGGLVYDLPSGGIYKVERQGNTTTVYDLSPDRVPSVIIGRRTSDGDQLIIGTPTRRHDDFGASLAITPGDQDGDED
jgi:hypothetical protein